MATDDETAYNDKLEARKHLLAASESDTATQQVLLRRTRSLVRGILRQSR